LFGVADIVLLALLGAGWLIVATRTARHVIRALVHEPSADQVRIKAAYLVGKAST
jgi:hypothetical protein